MAVIGAGPAGSAAAYFLARSGLRVALLDKSDFPRDKTCGDGLTPRALKVLDTMGILSEVEKHAFRCPGVTLRGSDDVTFRLDLSGRDDSLQYLLILPRFVLDNILLQHAIEAGTEFISHAKVEIIAEETDSCIHLYTEDGHTFESEIAVIATGANTGLLRRTGLLKKSPPPNLAARAYFENVEGLDDTVVLFFDGIECPGYGWVFPTGTGTANIGCGVYFNSRTPQPTYLRHLIETHPFLKHILRNARMVGPIKGHPLRTDFSGSLSGQGRILVIGESVGLVNPITGEGIDYALESAQLAAEAILEARDREMGSATMQKSYRATLSRKFRSLFMLGHLTQRVYLRDGVIDKVLHRIQRKPYLQQLILDACYGEANPISAFTPRTLWEILIP